MNTVPVPREILPSFRTPLRSFLEKLIPPEDILECSPEYGPATGDCFGEYAWEGVRICFLLDLKIGFPAAGTLTFSRSKQSWMRGEDLKFILWSLYPRNSRRTFTLDSVKSAHGKGPDGWKTLELSWGVVVTATETNSPVRFTFKGVEFDSPSTLYCLSILQRARIALEKIK